MQTTAIGTVANSLPENEVILLTLLISKGYILFAELFNIFAESNPDAQKTTGSISVHRWTQIHRS